MAWRVEFDPDALEIEPPRTFRRKRDWGQGTMKSLCLFAILLCSVLEAADPPVLWPKHIEFVPYPPLAKQARIQGTVVVRCWIKKDGSVRAVDAISGHPLLAENSKGNALKWTFFVKGSGKSKQVDLTYEYQLEGREQVYHSRNTMTVDFPYKVLVRARAPWVEVEGRPQ